MRIALVEAGVVVNVIEAESAEGWPGGGVAETASPGDLYDQATGTFTRPPPAPPEPPAVTAANLDPDDKTFEGGSAWLS